MIYNCKIHVNGDKEELSTLFAHEMTARDRSSIKMVPESKGMCFEIQAKDAVALRATMNSITKLLSLWENGFIKRSPRKG